MGKQPSHLDVSMHYARFNNANPTNYNDSYSRLSSWLHCYTLGNKTWFIIVMHGCIVKKYKQVKGNK